MKKRYRANSNQQLWLVERILKSCAQGIEVRGRWRQAKGWRELNSDRRLKDSMKQLEGLPVGTSQSSNIVNEESKVRLL